MVHNNIMKTIRKVLKGPEMVPVLLYSHLIKNMLRENFIMFAQFCFHNFGTFRRSFSTLRLPQGFILHKTQKYLYPKLTYHFKQIAK